MNHPSDHDPNQRRRRQVRFGPALPIIFVMALLAIATSRPFFSLPVEAKEQQAAATSFLGKPLFAPTLESQERQKLAANLAAAKQTWSRQPNSEENIIWYGRRLAYLYEYQQAVDVYTKGLTQFPKSFRLFRHRGHRFITLRQLDKAVDDLRQAAHWAEGKAVEIEPDGAPNAQNTPRGTTQFNIWYHLGLALYLQGDFQEAADAYKRCLEFSHRNDDLLTATTHWYYMTLRRLDKNAEAQELLKPIKAEMDIIENDDYHQLLLLYQGKRQEKQIFDPASATPLQLATVGYGIANWHYYNGRTDKAMEIWRQIVDTKFWPAFGYIAAEAELARKK